MYVRNYRLWKCWLENFLNSAVSEHALIVNMWKRPKYLQNLHGSAFVMFFFILREVDSESVSSGFRWYVRSVS